ncbi:MAG: HDIG domain-containing protein [Clostridia bacterium]|nr:HDIG domain-containing protein [Clostridia bacterium]
MKLRLAGLRPAAGLPAGLVRWAVSRNARRLALGLGFLAVTGLLLAGAFVPERVDVRLGQPAREAIKAPRDFVDQPTTRRLQEEAAAKVPDSYSLDPAVTDAVLSEVRSSLAAAESARASQAPPDARRAALRQALASPELGDEEADALLRLSDEDWKSLVDRIERLVLSVMEKGVQAAALAAVADEARRDVATWPYPDAVRSFAADFVAAALRPNLLFDAQKTLAAKEAARRLVQPVVIVKGQTIVADGNIVTADDLERLRDAGLLRSSRDWLAVVAAFGTAALLLALVALYLAFFRPALFQDEKRLLLYGLILVVVLAVARLVAPVSGYLVPTAWAGMLAAILIGPEVALVAVLYEAVAAGFLGGHDLRFLFAGLLSGFASVYSVRRLDQRGDVVRGGFLGALAGVLAALAVELGIGTGGFSMALGRDLAYAALAGVASGILTIGTLPYAEHVFDVLTSIRLLELSNPNHPLLRRLLVEAPGTYHHSLMVANLAEAGAEAVGANALLVRVGAYYHDVGKLRRPYFFVDNQFGGENPHERLAPSLSALILIAHVKDGLELAREYRLPRPIADFIAQHHGTMLASFFYQKAKDEATGPVDESAFRYPGPLPQTKEAAILMLADGAEASVRAIKEPTPDRIEAQVRRIVKDRLDTGQLDEADVTLRELDQVAQAFVRVLQGSYHQRLAYPESLDEEIRRARERAGERGRERRTRAAGGRGR